MATTLIDLYRKTLEEMGVVAAGESADADDTQVVSDKYAGLYDQLNGMGLVAWGPAADVPDYAVIPLTQMLAYVSALAFGKSPAPFVQLGALNLPQPSVAERQLRAQIAKQYVSWPEHSDYF